MRGMPVRIRTASAPDTPAILDVLTNAFGDEGKSIAELVVSLLHDPTALPLLSLVAEDGGEIIGHILFSAVHIEGSEPVSASILAPLAVAPQRQRADVGRQLVTAGLDALRTQGVDAVFVLGDPAYYTRFGFSPRHQVRAPYPLHYPEAWMLLSLRGRAVDAMGGTLVCADSLKRAELW